MLRCLWAVPRDSALSHVPSLAAKEARGPASPGRGPDSFIHPTSHKSRGGGDDTRGSPSPVTLTHLACSLSLGSSQTDLVTVALNTSPPAFPLHPLLFFLPTLILQQLPTPPTPSHRRHPNLASRDTTPVSALALSASTPGTSSPTASSFPQHFTSHLRHNTTQRNNNHHGRKASSLRCQGVQGTCPAYCR